jgi:protoporphyrinogen oxidase
VGQAASYDRDVTALVVGGGISGLTAAYRLATAGVEVRLVEGSDQLGGLGTFFRADSTSWAERFYHCIMPSDQSLIQLVDQLGLADRIVWKKTEMGIIYQGTHYPFNTAADLLRFRPISLLQRLRLGAMSLLMPRIGNPEELDVTRSEDWLRALYGDKLWKRLWEPMLRAKFGAHVVDVPALYLWQRLRREKNVSVRGYPLGGYKTIIDTLESAIRRMGGVVCLDSAVISLQEASGHMEVELRDGKALSADSVVSTVPLPLLHRAVRGSSLEAKVPNPELSYQGVVTAVLFLSRPLGGFYWTPVIHSESEFDGVIEMSVLKGAAAHGGRHLVYLVKYAPADSPLHKEAEQQIADRWTEQFLRLYSELNIKRSDIQALRVFRAPFVEPIYPLGYQRIKPDIHVRDSHLWLATTAQVYPNITSWNSSVELANRVTHHLLTQSLQGNRVVT